MHIRAAEESDIALILAFIRALAEYEKEPQRAVATPELLREWLFEKHIAETYFISENETSEPVGFVLFFYNFSTWLGRVGIHIEDLFVYENQRKKGYGIALLKFVAHLACERGCGRVEWACLNWNTPSMELYLRLGAVPMNEWTTLRLSADALEKFAQNGSAEF